jgi:hypothetical protein
LGKLSNIVVIVKPTTPTTKWLDRTCNPSSKRYPPSLLPRLSDKIFNIFQQHLGPFHSRKMPTTRVLSIKHKITRRFGPGTRYRCEFLGKPREAEGLADIPVWVLMCANNTGCEKLRCGNIRSIRKGVYRKWKTVEEKGEILG